MAKARPSARSSPSTRGSADATAHRELQVIPGIGPSMAQDLLELGVRRVSDLRRRNPERMYEALCDLRGTRLDRCVLYVFRCATYYAGRTDHDPERLKWWNWTDDKLPAH